MKNTGKLRGLDRRYDAEPLSSVEKNVLETFPNEYPKRNTLVEIETDEFTAVCPYSGLPDFATIRINYIPGARIIELRSLKYYLFSYRNVGIYQEHLVNRLLIDLAGCCRPKWMEVVADYKVRGGIRTIAKAETGRRPGGEGKNRGIRG
jgi:7-cyano-7-deazaguanine reductase